MDHHPSLRVIRAGVFAAALVGLIAHAPWVEATERAPARTSPATVPTSGDARVVVKFRSGSADSRAQALSSSSAPPQRAQALSARLGLALRDGRGLDDRSQLIFASGVDAQALATRLAAEPDVEWAVVDDRKRALSVPNDPLFPASAGNAPVVGQWYLRSAGGSNTPSAIGADAAWDITTGRSDVVVAVLDTGIRAEHPDLADKVLPGYDFISDVPTAADGDGRDADPSDPGDAVSQADVNTVTGCTASDVGPSSWHGTQTAGLIGAATNNGIGMASVGHDIRVMPLRVLGKCGGFDSDIRAAMLWAAGIAVAGVPANPHPAKVINMSLGSSGACNAAYQDAVNQVIAKGVVIVAAAGNDGVAVGSPANCTGVVGVTGLRQAGTKVGFSDLGPLATIGAPGGNCVNNSGACLYPLLTTSNSGTSTPGSSIYTDDTTHLSIGTSFSSPLVAGTVALMFSVDSDLTPAQAIAALKASATPFPTSGATAGTAQCQVPTANSAAQTNECYCTTSTCGAGMLNTAAAVAAVRQLTANIYPPVTQAVSTPIALDGAGSVAPSGDSIATYQWAITGGTGTATFTSATNASSATLTATTAGTVDVTLTVTDAANQTASRTSTLTIAAAASGGGGTPSPGGGGGGGALEPIWLIGLLAASLALRFPRFARRIRQSPSRARRPSGS